MEIEKILHPIRALGPGNRLVIWTLGCPRRCKGCSNPETQNPNPNADLSINQILERYDFNLIDGVTISGGEPFMQISELHKLVLELKNRNVKDILVYTGYTLQELLDMGKREVEDILANISVLIDGPYIDELHLDHRLKGSSNQNIIYIDRNQIERYENYLVQEKKLDIIRLANGEVHFIGIPPKDYRELYPEYIKSSKHITE